MPDTYVAAYDGSAAGRRAVDFALAQAKASGAALVVAHVLEWSPYSFLTPEEIEERHARRREELERAQSAIVKPLVDELSAAGVSVETEVRFGNIADTLAMIAKERGATQLFIGRVGEASVMTRLFGSVASVLAQVAPVPCTIVP